MVIRVVSHEVLVRKESETVPLGTYSRAFAQAYGPE